MVTKIEPERAWSSEVSIGEDDWNKFETAAGLKFSDDEKREMYRYITNYYQEYCYAKNGIRRNELHKKLSIIKKYSEQLFKEIDDIDIIGKTRELHGNDDESHIFEKLYGYKNEYLDSAIDALISDLMKCKKIDEINSTISTTIANEAEDYFEFDYGGFGFLSNLKENIFLLIEIARNIEEKYSDYESIGSNRDHNLTNLIINVKNMYEKISNDKTMSNKFVDLVLFISNAIHIQYEKDFGKSVLPHFARLTPTLVRQRVRDARKRESALKAQENSEN